MALRADLQSAVNSRRMLTKMQRGNPAWGPMNVSLMLAVEFLKTHPVCKDETVLEWCRKNAEHVRRLVPSNRPNQYARLMGLKKP